MRAGLLVAIGLLMATESTAHEQDMTIAVPVGRDQTVVDVGKANWQPLKVGGLEGGEIAVLRGDLAKSESEILLRFPAGFKVPNHNHTSSETYVWLSGAFTLIRSDGSRVSFDGPAFISFPGNAPPHALECGSTTACVLYVRYQRPFDIKYYPKPVPVGQSRKD